MTRQQMKRLWVSLGMGTALLTASMQEAHAQYMMGMTGLLNTPSAEMNETGRLMVGGNFLPKGMNPFGDYHTGNYFADLTFFSFLELAYRETLQKSSYMTAKPKYNQQDRSLSVKLQPLKEGKWWPAVAVGANDPIRSLGRNYYRSIYGVLTKHFFIRTAPIGRHRGLSRMDQPLEHPQKRRVRRYHLPSSLLPASVSDCRIRHPGRKPGGHGTVMEPCIAACVYRRLRLHCRRSEI